MPCVTQPSMGQAKTASWRQQMLVVMAALMSIVKLFYNEFVLAKGTCCNKLKYEALPRSPLFGVRFHLPVSGARCSVIRHAVRHSHFSCSYMPTKLLIYLFYFLDTAVEKRALYELVFLASWSAHFCAISGSMVWLCRLLCTRFAFAMTLYLTLSMKSP